jgi:hypothetical protein
VGIGSNSATWFQGARSVAIGEAAGFTGQGIMCVAIGTNAGNTNQSIGNSNNGFGSVAIGAEAGSNTQRPNSVAVGHSSGQVVQNQNCVAIGFQSQQNSPTDNSSQNRIAIGVEAQKNATSNSPGSIGIGFQTGGIQGAYAIAIGYGAGASQTSNSIILNATGSTLNSSTTGFYVAPIRNGVTGIAPGNSVLRYGLPYGNTNEITVDITPSDSRIKTNIEPLNDSECLNIVKQIEPKKYNYTIHPNLGKVYGFIAQEVEQYLPYAVPTSTKYIPNIYSNKTFEIIDKIDLNYTLYIHNVSADVNDILKVIQANNDIRVSVLEILSDKVKVKGNFIQPLENESILFVFGKEVNDFKGLDKEMLIPIMWSAIQELTRKVEQLQSNN